MTKPWICGYEYYPEIVNAIVEVEVLIKDGSNGLKYITREVPANELDWENTGDENNHQMGDIIKWRYVYD